MPVPPPTLSTPSLPSDSLYFQGVTLGPGTPFGIKKLEGFDKPDVRSGNANWSMWPGASVGNNQLNTRKITLTLDVGPTAGGGVYGSYGSLAAATQALVTACSTEGATEYPLWVQLPGMPLVCCYARVLKTSFPWDVTADLGGLLQNGSIQFEATDPYLYSAPSTSTTISLPTAGTGFSPNMIFPLSFGGGGTPNTAAVTNSGDVTCWPTLVITGPCLNPSVSNGTIAGNPTIQTAISLNAGDQLWIDCRLGAITYYPSGSTVGTPYQFVLQPGSEYFGLPAGTTSSIAFNSADTSSVAGTLQVQAASAYDALL